MTTVREHLDALGFTSTDHDANVREALLELRHARVSLAFVREENAALAEAIDRCVETRV